MNERRDLTMAEVAARLRVSVATVRRWIDTDGLPAMCVGKTIRIPRDHFEAWYRKHALRRHVPVSSGWDVR